MFMTQGVLKTDGISLMMYFKNNWNAGPFFLLHGYFKHPFYLIESVTLPLWYLQALLVKKNKHPMSSLYIPTMI
jgi:hypothetical protein